MSFRYDMRGKDPQQQAIARQREREEKIRKEEAKKRKRQEEIGQSIKYSFNFEGVKDCLSKEEFETLIEEVDRYKDNIITHLLIEEDRGNNTLCTPITTGEFQGLNFIELLSKEVCFTRNENKINVTRRLKHL